MILKDHFCESIIERLVARPKTPVVYRVLLQIADMAPICVVRFVSDSVPDDARLQREVFILGRHAAKVTQQSEFSKIPDVASIPILHTIRTKFLYSTSLQENYRSCILSLVQWQGHDHNHHTSEVDDLLRCLGQRIRDLRKQRGWSQAAASEHIGVHWTYLGHLERAEKPGVSVMSIARIANAFGVTLADMFAGLEQGDAPNPTGKAIRKADEVIKVGRNAIKIEKLIQELRLERNTLKEAVRLLRQIPAAGQVQASRKKRQSSKPNKR